MIDLPLDGQTRAVAQQLLARYGIGRAHKGLSGGAREEALRRALAALLPSRFRLAPGEIAAVSGDRSPAMDIIIFDGDQTPLLDDDGLSVVVPVEAVYGVIEVSSMLSVNKLETDLKKIRAAKGLKRQAYFAGDAPPDERMLGIAFGYASASLASLQETAETHDDSSDPSNNLDLICTLDHGVIANHRDFELDDEFSVFAARCGADTKRISLVAGGDVDQAAEAFGWMYALLADDVLPRRLPATRPLRYWYGPDQEDMLKHALEENR